MTRREFITAVGAGLIVASPLPVLSFQGRDAATIKADMKHNKKAIFTAEEAIQRLQDVHLDLLALELYFEDAGCTRFASSCFELDTLAELTLDSFKSVIEENQKSTTVQQIKEDMNEALYYYLDM
jgi:hypothetical protein